MGTLFTAASISEAPLPPPWMGPGAWVSGGLDIDESESFLGYFRFKMNAPAAMSAMSAIPPMVPPTIAPTGVEAL